MSSRLSLTLHDLCVGAGKSRPRWSAETTLALATDEEMHRPMDRDALTATAQQWVRRAAKRLPSSSRTRIIRNLPGRRVRWGSLRRTRPFSDRYGFDRGLPIDRYYIEAFLAREAASIQGEGLEVGDPRYSPRFGGPDAPQIHIVAIDPTNPEATVIADLTVEGSLPDQTYDTIIATQALPLTADHTA